MNAAEFTLARYREVLSAGTSQGYRFVSYPEAKSSPGSGPLCLLRHDCDNDLAAVVRMAQIEKEAGVRSTWFVMLRSAMYNVLCFPARRIVLDLLEGGHWLGLHFDERVLPSDASHDELRSAIDRERRILEKEFGVEVPVVSFHQPGPRVLARELKLDCLNTYEPDDTPGFHYYSDSNLVLREGCPSELLSERSYQRLHLLVHPEWWTEAFCEVNEKWQQMLRNGFALAEQSLADREDAYLVRHTLDVIERGDILDV